MTNSVWKQFSLYPSGCRNKFQPQQVLHTFIPVWLNQAKPAVWRVLFEPSALIRFQSNDLNKGFAIARRIAEEVGLVFEAGDCSVMSSGGEDYFGEHDIYGHDLWEAAVKFLQASSELSLEIQKLGMDEQYVKIRKFLHVYLNTLGLNYLEETAVCRRHESRMTELAEKYFRS